MQSNNHADLRSILLETIRKAPVMSAMTLLIIIGAVITALFPPLFLQKMIDGLINKERISLQMALFYFGMIAVSGILEAGQNVMITVLGQKIMHGLRSKMCDKLHRLPAAYYTANESGKITSRFVNDADVVDALFTDGIIGMFADACSVISILIMICILSKGLGILMLIVTPVLFVVTRIFQKKMLAAQMENRIAISKVNNHIPETIRNIRMIHTLFRYRYMEQKYDDYIQESYHATDRTNLYDSVYSPIIIFTGSCVTAVMMVCAAMNGGMRDFFGVSVGTAVAMIAYVGKVFEPLESIGMEIQSIQSAVAGVKRINEFLCEEERVFPDQKTQDQFRQESGDGIPVVSFENVTFRYGKDRAVFENLSFTIQKGEHVTFTGRTGAGKSTIFRLLLGLYQPESGAVLISGEKASDYPDDRKRKLFGYVEQTFHLVSGTLADQISLSDPCISMEQVRKAAELVGLHTSIMGLADGYDTPAQQIAFSQGQFQLLSIARAVAAEPKILLLDEITADLDSDTQQYILTALARAGRGRTVLSISHRLQEYTDTQRLIEIGKESGCFFQV